MFKFSGNFEYIFKNLRIRPRYVVIDNTPFWLHYRITTLLLSAGMVIVLTKDFTGTHITCVTHETEEPAIPENVIDSFCYSFGTFTTDRGIGPVDENTKVITHRYYQWVPYVLFVQAVSFYLPHVLWKHVEDGRIKTMVETIKHFFNTTSSEQSRQHKILQANIFINNLFDRLKAYQSWAWYLILCESINVGNIFLQWYLTNVLINHEFNSLGFKVLDNSEVLDKIFPKLSKCSFHKYGPSGTIENYDALCVLPLNIVNEKTFVVLWWWYLILGAVGISTLVWRFIQLCLHKNERFNEVLWGLRNGDVGIVNTFCYSEWLLLYYTSTNLPPRMLTNIFKSISEVLNTQPESVQLITDDNVEVKNDLYKVS